MREGTKILQEYYKNITFWLHHTVQLKTGAKYAILFTGCGIRFVSHKIRKDKKYDEK